MAKKVVQGMAELKRNLASFKRQAGDVIEKAVFNGCVMIQNEAKSNHPYTDRTGNLTNSIQAMKPKSRGSKIIGETVAGMEYATAVELGVKSGDKGTRRPYPFMFPALEKISPRINREIKDLIKRIRWVEM